MSEAFEVGAIAMRTQQRALEILANNIANVNTQGFKRAQVRYADVPVLCFANSLGRYPICFLAEG